MGLYLLVSFRILYCIVRDKFVYCISLILGVCSVFQLQLRTNELTICIVLYICVEYKADTLSDSRRMDGRTLTFSAVVFPALFRRSDVSMHVPLHMRISL